MLRSNTGYFWAFLWKKYELKVKAQPRADKAVPGVHVGFGGEFL